MKRGYRRLPDAANRSVDAVPPAGARRLRGWRDRVAVDPRNLREPERG